MNKNKKKILTNVLSVAFITILLWLFSQVNAQAKIQVEFCNDWNKSSSLNFNDVDASQEKEICIIAWNLWDREDLVTMYFVDWAINPHTPQFTACKNEKDTKIWLSKYAFFTDEKFEKYDRIEFNVKPWETVQKKAKLKYSDSFSWMSYWCLITLTWKQKTEKWKLNILLRRWNVIKAKVNWDIKLWLDIWWSFDDLEQLHGSWLQESEVKNYVKTLFKNDKMIIQEYLQTWNISISTKILNTGNTKMVWSLDLKVMWSLGYENIESKQFILLPLEEEVVTFDIKDLPIYKWTFDIELDITKKAEFEFDSEDITDEMRKEISEKIVWEIYIFPTKLLIIVSSSIILIITILTLIITTIRKRRARLDNASVNYTVKSWDTLNSIADEYWCEWSLIAKENNIPAPYIISEWTIIKVFDFKGN